VEHLRSGDIKMVARLLFTKTNLILGQSPGKSHVAHGLPE
jgi:hypothetical protein